MAGMSVAVWTAATMVQGCGSDTVNQINNTSTNPLFPADQGNGNVNNPTPPAFVQPAVLRSTNGKLETTLQTKFAMNQVGAVTVNMRSFNGQLTGPTLRVKPGDTLRILLDNQMPANPDAKPANINQPHQLNTTNLHTHGLHVSPQGNSDNIFVEVDPGAQFQYEYSIPANHPPGTMWYHPHKHGSSSTQLISGMAGALIIEGGLDEVPAIKQARDLVYLITEINVDGTNTVPDWTMANPNPFTLANRKFLINGQLLPTLQAFSGEVVRLRVINASVRSAVPFSITGHTLNLISLDGIALPSMRAVNEILLPPAGRADILVRCGAPGNYDVVKGLDTSVSNPDPLVNIGVLTVLNTVVNMQLPDKLPAQPYPNVTDAQLTSNMVTQITFEQNSAEPAATGFQNFTIDQKHFDPNVVNQSVPLNSVLEWELINNSPNGHPFHIHINPFMVVSVNNVALPEPEWHDTFNIPKNGRIRIRHRFEDFKGLFVLHCHILLHEDLGMMQTVNVT